LPIALPVSLSKTYSSFVSFLTLSLPDAFSCFLWAFSDDVIFGLPRPFLVPSPEFGVPFCFFDLPRLLSFDDELSLDSDLSELELYLCFFIIFIYFRSPSLPTDLRPSSLRTDFTPSLLFGLLLLILLLLLRFFFSISFLLSLSLLLAYLLLTSVPAELFSV
jgi:hypothetical protein